MKVRVDSRLRDKIAAVIRAARKNAGLTQVEVAREVGITQGSLSKMEAGQIMPLTSFWFNFCRLTGIDALDTYYTGRIDGARPVSLRRGDDDGRYRLPAAYREHAGSTVRSARPFLDYFAALHGEQKLAEFLRARGADPDYLITVDHPISLQLILDLSTQLVAKGRLKRDSLAKLVRPVSLPETHGRARERFDDLPDPRRLLHSLVDSAELYEVNFAYRVEDSRRGRVDLSVAPRAHLDAFDYRGEALGDFLCQYKKQYFQRFTAYGKRKPGRLVERECQFHGAQRCVYRIQLES